MHADRNRLRVNHQLFSLLRPGRVPALVWGCGAVRRWAGLGVSGGAASATVRICGGLFSRPPRGSGRDRPLPWGCLDGPRLGASTAPPGAFLPAGLGWPGLVAAARQAHRCLLSRPGSERRAVVPASRGVLQRTCLRGRCRWRRRRCARWSRLAAGSPCCTARRTPHPSPPLARLALSRPRPSMKKPPPKRGRGLRGAGNHLPIFGGSRKAMAKNRVDRARARMRM